MLHVPWMTGIEPITPARRRLTPARQVTVGVTCYRSPHHRRETRMRDEDDSRVPGRTRHNPEDHIPAELEALTVRYVPMLTSEQLAALPPGR